MKRTASSSFALLLLLGVSLFTSASHGATLSYSWSGQVGTNSTATALFNGGAFGNSAWRLNGTLLAAGTTITFNYMIADTATDLNASASTGRFTGGTLTVSIPTMGVSSGTNESYDLMFAAEAAADVVFATPTDNTGFAVGAYWPTTADPWPNPNVLSTIANPNALDMLGTSPNGSFSLALQSGQTLTTTNSELLVNPTFSSSTTAVPEPAQLGLAGLAGLILLLRRRKQP